MTTEDGIIGLFSQVDDQMHDVGKHSQARLWPSEVVTLALLFAIKGVGNRAFYRCLQRDWRPLLPRLPTRPRLFRLFSTHRDWTERFLAADTYGIELVHPIREGRSAQHIGQKGISNHRWIVGVHCAWCCITWGWWWRGTATRPTCTTRGFSL